MNAPARYELFVLEDGEKPCVLHCASSLMVDTNNSLAVWN